MQDEPGPEPTSDARTNADIQLGQALRGLLTTLSVAESLTPREKRGDLLTLVVRTAARVVGARAASLFLLDESGAQLTFEVAIGPKAEEVRRFKVPIGRGIAGTVAATGQPIAISAPEEDPRFAAEIARSVGHIPQSILCVPMRHGDTIIGVLEVLDKEGRDTFTQDDIEVLSYFAEIASLATEQVRRQDDLRAALNEIISSWVHTDDDVDAGELVRGTIDTVLASTRMGPEYRSTLRIAASIVAIARHGDAERELCYEWLRVLRRYVEARQQPFMGAFPWSP